ncbi:hypothetical protein PRIPAC_95527 [Pristionchus pacificus]|uniref:Uncharacterized protein n=1 Tax=Pristionchus pacificus TaxID=54126 RepID=A0A2A6BCV4_PRIPA|nr:hypothetical protein PRIPAC_95527 [Pristionchus pacificus]|eukprot:PDM63707.1 hypothetical protein PRIPAC_49680 [Pristionchus pacificus]
MRDDDLHIVEEHSNEKEDSQTPTDKGSVMDDDECLPSNSKLATEVSSLQKQCTILSHQMNLIMGRLQLPQCPCTTCRDVIRSQPHPQMHPLHHPHVRLAPPPNGAPATHPTVGAAAQPAAAPRMMMPMPMDTPVAIPIAKGIKILNPSLIPRAVAPVQQMAVLPTEAPEGTPSENGSTSTEGDIKEVTVIKSPQTDAATNQLLTSLFNTPGVLQTISNANPSGTPNPFAEQNHGGRKSKYCNSEQKRMVAEYASMHGAAQAARKYNIPPSVAAYYQRKLAKMKQNEKQTAAVAVAQALGVPPSHIDPESMCAEDSPLKSLDCTPGTPTTPSYLRGRGRGRPKLIGDELDAELIEFMTKIKMENPQIHFNPSTALNIARDYILKKSPQILKESGGSVELKLTWAMKLVSRISEREQEIKLGLPAGALSNYGRTGLQQLQSISGNGANLFNDITSTLFLQQLQKLTEDQAFVMPEITNVKELNLADFTSIGDDAMSDEKEDDKDGSTTPEVNEETEKAMDTTMNCQPSLTAC